LENHLAHYFRMKITMSYSGGTSRGWQLGSVFDKSNMLVEFFIPSCGRRIDYFPARMVPYIFGDQAIDPRRIRTSLQARLVRGVMRRTAWIRGAKPTERYWACRAIDHSVARRLRGDSDLLMAESHIALSTIARAKAMGMKTILDRTNSHIAYQSEIWREENERLGVKWIPSDDRDIQQAIEEYHAADRIFVLSSYVKRTFLDRGVPEQKLVCVPSGIDLARFHQAKKNDPVFRLIYCGILQAKKGVHYLLRAFSELNLKHAELWLIGSVSEEMRPILARYQDSFRHLGFVPNSELAHIYSQGSAFVLPSLEEGLAKVIVEAMACGLPVIATTNTGAEDVVRDGTDGYVIPIRNVEILKERILTLYHDPDLCQQMGQNAIRRVHAEFTLERYVQRLLTAFSEIRR